MRQKIILLLCALAATAPAVAIDVTRPDVAAWIEATAREHKLDAAAIRQTLAAAEVQQSILEAIARPAEKAKPWSEYRAIFITPERVAAGVLFWREHAERLERIATSTGVPAEMLAGIIGVETYFGQRAGKHRLVNALTTLAFEYPPRAEFFKKELAQLFVLAKEEKVPLDSALGSYAGAMGVPQFIPSSYRNFAVDGDADGQRDLFGNWDDVLSSVANYFVKHNWKAGEAVATRAQLTSPCELDPEQNLLKPDTTVAALDGAGVRFTSDRPGDAAAGLLSYDGRDGREYWVGFDNFFVITRYNRSTMYALAVYQLGQAIGEAVRAQATAATTP